MADLEQERSWPFLEAYLKNPLSSTVLVFCYKHKTLDSRKKLGKLLSGKDSPAVLMTRTSSFVWNATLVPSGVIAGDREDGTSVAGSS